MPLESIISPPSASWGLMVNPYPFSGVGFSSAAKAVKVEENDRQAIRANFMMEFLFIWNLGILLASNNRITQPVVVSQGTELLKNLKLFLTTLSLAVDC